VDSQLCQMTMNDFPVRIPDHLPSLIRAFRIQAGLSQADVALRLGVSQQSYSALERHPEAASVARLLRLLSVLRVELVLRNIVPSLERDAGDLPGALPDR